MHRYHKVAALVAALMLAGCAPHAAVKLGSTINVTVDQAGHPAANKDEEKVLAGLAMIQAGRIQAAIDGPLTEVISDYENRYKDTSVTVFCARGLADAIVYSALGDKSVNGKADVAVEVIGPAWAQAHWARGYAYSEMARYSDARTELEKALELSPMDSQYKSELAFNYQHSADWKKMLSLYQDAEGDADISGASDQVSTLKCVALRGQGYALVEMHRLDEASKAYHNCLKLVPDEPKSLGELDYIKGLRARAH